MRKKTTSEEDRELEERLRRFDERYEQISRILLGETITGIPGLLQRQINDEKIQNDIMTTLHDIKNDIRLIKHDILSLRNEFDWYRDVLKLPTKKKFWVGVVIILAILVLLSRWTSDAYHFIWNAILKYFNKYF